ncbi:MAG: 4-hydroxythreonine-4-phosphate dehydrogenase PdxA [Bacteroidetes bacterium]|nr:4-hydroxythreonine-4-phosphate dehydrogenase PdxA [Bacteroidota bacterium]
MSKEHIRVAISLGDYNGVGPEVILKSLSNPKITEFCTPCIYASPKVISYFKKQMGLHDLHIYFADSANHIHHRKVNLVVTWDEETAIQSGTASQESGDYAFKSLEAATRDVLNGDMDVLVTAPLDKSTVNRAERPFHGHTDYLAEMDGAENHMMILVCDEMRVGLVTGHVPIKEVASQIDKDKIIQSIQALNNSLSEDFGIGKPRIAVLGLNPHAGDNGLLGDEESNFILPAVKEAIEAGIYAFGPYPSDGFFGTEEFKKFDGILAMYHDQGLIPFKLLGFEDGVNFTSGLSFIRTSPDHGTAYAIAGQGTAVESSFRNALYLAVDLYRKRKRIEDDSSNPLKFTPLRRERFRMDF